MLKYLKRYHKGAHFHFIGIGGVGMSGLAEILLREGFVVSGSDLKESEYTKRLIGLGAKISYEHRKDLVLAGLYAVVYSASISEDNVEYKESKRRGLKLISRATLLGEITGGYNSLAVTGTHGKTTTSALLGKVLYDVGFDPLIILGGTLSYIGSNVYCGKGDWSIYEGCEAYKSLYSYKPQSAIITNIDLDHLDCFKSLKGIEDEFIDFVERIPFYGSIIVNGDDKSVIKVVEKVLEYKRIRVLWFGLGEGNDIVGYDIKKGVDGTSFKIKDRRDRRDKRDRKDRIYTLTSSLYGTHNVYNVLGVVSACAVMGIGLEEVQKSVKSFENAGRRLELLGKLKGGKIIYSDYAHHPKEIESVLDAVKQKHEGSRIITIFQPHLYSRTKQFYKEFAKALSTSDSIYLLSIYAAREREDKSISHKAIAEVLLKDYGHKHVESAFELDVGLFKHLEEGLAGRINRAEVVLVLGAGDIHDKAVELLNDML